MNPTSCTAAAASESRTARNRAAHVPHYSYTLDVLAWALFQNGKIAEAKSTIERALAVGTKDPRIVKHAAAIGAKANPKA